MAKKEDITLIIAKSFSSQYLTQKECDLCKDLTMTKLVSEWGLNDIQSSKVLNWCTISNRRFEDFRLQNNLQKGSLLRIQAQINF